MGVSGRCSEIPGFMVLCLKAMKTSCPWRDKPTVRAISDNFHSPSSDMMTVRSDSSEVATSIFAIDGASVGPSYSMTSAPAVIPSWAVSTSPAKFKIVTRSAKSWARTTADAMRSASSRTTKTILIESRLYLVPMNDSVKACLEGPVSLANGNARCCCHACS